MPLSLVLDSGSQHDSKRLNDLVDRLRRPPRMLYADSAYDTEAVKDTLESMEIEANIPVNPRNGRKPRPYNVGVYRKVRSAVERSFGWLKSLRRITIRYERLTTTYRALITIACILIHLRYGV